MSPNPVRSILSPRLSPRLSAQPSDEPMRLAPGTALARTAVQREARRQFHLTVLMLLAASASLLVLIPH